MNVTEHLWITMNEEIVEVLENIIERENIFHELNDLLAVGELLEIEVSEENAENYHDFVKAMVQMHYSISKGLRFGFEDIHPETGYKNIESVKKNFSKVFNYIKGGSYSKKELKKPKKKEL